MKTESGREVTPGLTHTGPPLVLRVLLVGSEHSSKLTYTRVLDLLPFIVIVYILHT